MKMVTPNMGKLFSKNGAAYAYLDASIQKFPEGKAFVTVLNSIDYKNTYHKKLTLGICSIYCGIK
jgi:demethylmenaquinone methyltransferase/2-methoxy-6-polyprenyl-1,4-benzoquinol methylase